MASRLGFQSVGPDVIATANANVTYRCNNQEHATIVLNCTSYTAATVILLAASVDGINYFPLAPEGGTATGQIAISAVGFTVALNKSIALHSIRVVFVSGTASVTVTGAFR